MIFTPSNNPKIEELTKSYRERQFPLSSLGAIKLLDGSRQCVWCLIALKGRQLKWCSNNCSNMAMAHFYPQGEWGLHVLLARQNFECNVCNFSYMSEIQNSLKYINRYHSTFDPSKLYTDISSILMRVLKNRVPQERKPEVDHIVPISKGGTSIGLDNHQCICYSCHKAKTKIDNSGPRKKV